MKAEAPGQCRGWWVAAEMCLGASRAMGYGVTRHMPARYRPDQEQRHHRTMI